MKTPQVTVTSMSYCQCIAILGQVTVTFTEAFSSEESEQVGVD